MNAAVAGRKNIGGIRCRIITAALADHESDGFSFVVQDIQFVPRAQFIQIAEHAGFRQYPSAYLSDMPGNDGNALFSRARTARKPAYVNDIARYFYYPIGCEAVILKTRVNVELRDLETHRGSICVLRNRYARRSGHCSCCCDRTLRPGRINCCLLDGRVNFPP